ncbi:periplasmic binding protein-like I [Obelidium mucronatum]|nr:periplasmic binding protein-like I [Obelidium mucronatum]
MKNETSVTIALVGPFRGSGLTFNKSRVGGYNAQTIMRRVSPGSFPYSFFWNQVAAEMSIQRINEDHSILPNTTIKIKRFNSGTSPGDSIATALEIATEHPDVFAVYGEMFSLTTLDTRQLNKAIYPYYIQTLSITSFAEAVPSILKCWNVRRAVILLESPDGLCGSLKEFILRNNIQLVDVIQTRYRTVDYVIDVLIRSDARYVVACLNPDPMAAIYFELAKREAMVGSGYVWLATNVPAMNDNTMIPKYGENYRAQIKGLIVVGASLDQSVKIATTADDFSRRLQTSLRISEDVVSTIWYTTSAMFSYDCVGLLSHGLNKVLPSDSRLIASDIKKLHNFMNHSLFQQTGYTGMTGNPLILSKNGDAVRSMTVYQFDEFMSVFTIGQVDSDSLKFSYLKNKLPVFHDNTSVPPPDGPELLPDLITFAEHRGKMLLILAGIGICLSCLFFAMVIRFRNTKTLTSASPLFLGVMGLGCSLLYASMLFYIETPSVLQLKGRLWIQATAMTLIVGSLFLKNTRIWVIYNYKRKFSKLELSDKIWMIPMAILFSLQQLIAALWFRFSRFILVKRVSYKTQFNGLV